MRVGELRRFKTPIRFSYDARRVSGQVFMVVDISGQGPGHIADLLLVDGAVEKGWDFHWVRDNSEALDETR